MKVVRKLAFLASVSALLGGCLTPSQAPLSAADGSAVPTISWNGTERDGTRPLLWHGTNLTGRDDYEADPPCLPSNCLRYPFALKIPADYWDSHAGGLAFSVSWTTGPNEPWRWFTVRIVDAAGNAVAKLTPWELGELAVVAFAPRIASGSYEAVVVMMAWGEGGFDAALLVDAPPIDETVREQLPDVVTLTPFDLQITYPGDFVGCVDANPAGQGYVCQGAPPQTATALGLAGSKGCNIDESVEHGAKRCLRFNNLLGNAGQGVLDLWLSPEEGRKAYAGQGQFIQRIYSSDGSVRQAPAGLAAFHPFHRHFHALGIVEFKVFKYDLATHARGAAVASERKTGMCLFHSGLVELGKPGTRPIKESSTCFETGSRMVGASIPKTKPLLETGWNMALAPNWFDIYAWTMDENYVDVSGVPDGIYELVSTANVDGRIQEASRDNNVGSVVFQMTGDKIRVVR